MQHATGRITETRELRRRAPSRPSTHKHHAPVWNYSESHDKFVSSISVKKESNVYFINKNNLIQRLAGSWEAKL